MIQMIRATLIFTSALFWRERKAGIMTASIVFRGYIGSFFRRSSPSVVYAALAATAVAGFFGVAMLAGKDLLMLGGC